MHGPSIYSVSLILFIQALLSWVVYYLLRRLVPAFSRPSMQYGYWTITLVTIVIVSLSRWFHAAGIPIQWLIVSFAWVIGLLFMLILLLLIQAIVYFTAKKGKPALPPAGSGGAISRRDFLRNSIAITPILAVGMSAKGIYSASDIIVQRYQLSLANFPPALQSIKVVQISDTHIGPFFGQDKLEEVLTMAGREKPDLLVITGDLIDDLNQLAPTMERLTNFATALPYGMYFCWGNHEYFKDIARIRRVLQNSPLVVLENSSQLIIDGEQPFYLAGVDFPWASNGVGQGEKRQRYLKDTLQKIPEGACIVLLSHHPDFITNAFAAEIPLTLTGHTHGGQIGLLGKPLLPLQYQFMRGLYRQDNLYGYVSTGAGHWMPFRLGCPAEIAIFTLTG